MSCAKTARTSTATASNIPCLICAFSASVTTGGTIYAFGIYGDALKKSLQLSQLQLDNISATFFIAGLLTWMPGMVVDRRGMRFSMLLGGTAGAASTLTYWAVSRRFLLPQASTLYIVLILAALAVAICLSCGLIIGSIFKLTLVCGGPKTKGSAVGIAKGFVGLGAGVYATIFQALRTPDETALDFLPVLAFFFIICCVLPALFLLPRREHMATLCLETTPLHFRTIYVSLLVLGGVILIASLAAIRNQNDDAVRKRNYSLVLLILVVWLGPIYSLLLLPRQHSEIILDQTDDGEEDGDGVNPSLLVDERQSLVHNNSYQEGKVEDNTTSYESFSTATSTCTTDEKTEDLNLQEMLQTPSAWLMLWTTAILVGSGTYLTNNMAQLVESLGFPESLTAATLAIFSVSQAAARILTGVLSEAALQHNPLGTTGGCLGVFLPASGGLPRPFFLVVASTIALVAHLMLSMVSDQIAFVVGCTISGIAFGMAWPLMVLIVSDVFGTVNHGANYMFFDGFTKAVGTTVLSTFVAGNIYEAHVVDEDKGDGMPEFVCYGLSCFRGTHLTVAGLALTCIAASFGLIWTSRNAYSKRSA